VDFGQRPFGLTLGEGAIQADTLIVATGARARWLGLPEELEFRTRIGGVTAMEEATFLTKFANRVTVVHRRETLRASKIMQERALKNPRIAWLFDTVVEKILGGPGQGVTGARVRNVMSGEVKEVSAGGIFMAIGHEPNTAPFRGKLEMNAEGYLVTREGTTATSVPGVFAAGDVQDFRYRQAVTAAGSGCMAAIDAERFLSHQ